MVWHIRETCVWGGIYLSHTQPVHAGFVAVTRERLEARRCRCGLRPSAWSSDARLPRRDVQGVPEGRVPSIDLEFTPSRYERYRGPEAVQG